MYFNHAPQSSQLAVGVRGVSMMIVDQLMCVHAHYTALPLYAGAFSLWISNSSCQKTQQIV